MMYIYSLVFIGALADNGGCGIITSRSSIVIPFGLQQRTIVSRKSGVSGGIFVFRIQFYVWCIYCMAHPIAVGENTVAPLTA